MKYTDFIPPLSDFGFKLLFGTEKNKTNLIVLLNAILHDRLGYEKIIDLRLNPTEYKGENPDRKTIQYDIHCLTDRHHRIIVEMQNKVHPNFEDRMFYYGAEAVSRQDRRIKGHSTWDFHIDPVVSLAICNFKIKKMGDRPVSHFSFREVETNMEYGRQLNLVFLQLPWFSDDVEDCNTELDKIMFSLKNMERIQNMQEIPFSKQEGDFYSRIAQASRYSALSEEERLEYDRYMKYENDRLLEQQWAREEGFEEGYQDGHAKGIAQGIAQGIVQGLEEGAEKAKMEDAKKMIELGLDLSLISEITGLSLEKLSNIKSATI